MKVFSTLLKIIIPISATIMVKIQEYINIDIEIRKLKQQQKLEEIARNRNVAVKEIKEE